MKKKHLLLCLLAICFHQSVGQVAWPSFLAKQDPVWDTLGGYYFDGPMSGNGLIGFVLHRQDANRGSKDVNTLLFEINRTDVVDSCDLQQEGYRFTRTNVGRFSLPLLHDIVKTRLRIDLWNGVLTGYILTKKDSVHLRAYTHAVEQVMVFEVYSARQIKYNFTYVPDPSGCIRSFGAPDFVESATYDLHPVPQVKISNGINTHHQQLNAGRSFTVGWIQENKQNTTHLYTSIAYSHPAMAKPFSVVDVLSGYSLQDKKLSAQRHYDWWHAFYRKSFVSIPDSKLESFYWIQMYKYGSLMRPDMQILDLSGPWYNHTIWRGIWWNWNTQAMYLPLLTANHTELMEPLINTLEKNKANLALNAGHVLKDKVLAISRASSFDCYSPINLNDTTWLQAGRETGNLTWVLHNVYLQGMYTADDRLLRDRLFPLLKKAINLYLHIKIEGADKKIHLPVTFSPEYKSAADCNYDLALFEWGCQTLLKLNELYGLKDPLASQWQDVMQRLTAFPNDDHGLLIGKDVKLTESHRHFSHMLGIYPLRVIQPSSVTNKNLIQSSLSYWLGLKGGLAAWSHLTASSMYSALGKGDSAMTHILQSMYSFSAATQYREAGMCMETPLMGVDAINNLLLQSHGKICVFPAIPSGWKDLSFANLLAEGGFLISASRKNGITQWIKIESKTGKPFKLQTDIPFEKLRTNPVVALKRINTGEIVVNIKKGQSVYLYTGTKKEFKLEPVKNSLSNSWGNKIKRE